MLSYFILLFSMEESAENVLRRPSVDRDHSNREIMDERRSGSSRRSRSRYSRARPSRARPSRSSRRSRSPILPSTSGKQQRSPSRRRHRELRSPPVHHRRSRDVRPRTSRHRSTSSSYSHSPNRSPVRDRCSADISGKANTSNNLGSSNENLSALLNFMNNFLKSENSQKLHFDKNMIPEFDPTAKNHRIENWIAKVNECAQIYNWSEQQIPHFALPRLVGHAKKWYEGLYSVNRTWLQWQECLKKAFPSDSNYGNLLTEMLERRFKTGESLDNYYYDKTLLLNACEIFGKKAVDCIIHGLEDRTLKASASSGRFTEPEDLLCFLKDICNDRYDNKINKIKSTSNSNNDITCSFCKKLGHTLKQCRALFCFNCKNQGHKISQCNQPIIKCDSCQKFGHKKEDCFKNKNKNNLEKRVMNIDSSENQNSKFYKPVNINNNFSKMITAFIDFGSDCSLISKALVDEYGLVIKYDNVPVIKGIGNGTIVPIGKTEFRITIDKVESLINAFVISPLQLHVPLLIGQNFTELPHILVIKTKDSLAILNRNYTFPDIVEEASLVRLVICESTYIDKIGLIPCFTEDISDGIIFIPNSYRNYCEIEYWIQEGLYSVSKGKVSVFVVAPSTPVYFKSHTLLVRAEKVKFSEDKPKMCLQAQARFETIDYKEININNELTPQQRDAVYQLIQVYRSTFAQNLSELGCTNLTEMDLKLSDHTPVVYRPYRLSYKDRETVKNMVGELLQNGIIEESSSSYASPILLVSKKTGGQRLCVDYRTLNSRTIKDHFPLPRIEDQIDSLNGSKYFTNLDLTSGYYQIPISPDCRHLTAFITPDGLYQFKRMPFGLVNAPAVFQRTINKALKLNSVDGNNKPAEAYMDDIIVVSKDFNEGVQKLENTFKLLNEANLTLNIKKCNFFQTNIDYLGFEISYEGIKPGKTKIEAVKNFPTPKNVHEVRQFIGLASYFRRFIKDFSVIARPLTDLTKKNQIWNWSNDQIQSFDTLKEKLIQRPVLALYNPKYITELHTDASKIGLAGILLQKESENSPLKPIAFYSRKTTIDEQKFHAYDLETLAVITSLNRFRVYLLGISFTIVTDCNALRATFSKRDILPRIARWWLTLQEYDCNIIYRPNSNMLHVDALSRNPVDLVCEESEPEILRTLAITQHDWLMSLQLTDPKISHIRQVLEDPKYNELVDIKQNFLIKDNKLFRKVGQNDFKWVVPKGARFQILRLNHDDVGHFSVEKTLARIKRDFWFPKMKKFVYKYVKSCIHCAYGKDSNGKKEGFLHPIPKPDIPFHTIHIDHLGPFVKSSRGNMYLLLIVDGYTKFCIIKPLRNLKTSATVKALDDVFSTFGFPTRLISDRGTTFTSKEFEKFCTDSKIKHILNAVSSPRSNGQVERYNQTVLGSLASYTDKLGETKWDQELRRIQWGLNNTLNKGIGKTPSEALFGRTLNHAHENMFSDLFLESRDPNQSIEEIRSEITEHIEKDQVSQKQRFDKNRKSPTIYKIGDLVKINKQVPSNEGQSRKLLPKFSGPYKITKILDNDRYEVSTIPGTELGKRKYSNIWAVDQIKPWINIHINKSSSSDSEEE